MDIGSSLSQLLGAGDPGSSLQDILAGVGLSSAPTPDAAPLLTPEAADPSTASPTGRILARLRGAPTAAPPPGSMFGGLGQGMLAAIAASRQPHMDKGTSFLTGLASGLSASQAARQQNWAAQEKARQDNFASLAKLFELQHQQETGQRAQAAQDFSQKHVTAQEARAGRQDEETKRYHDLQAKHWADIYGGDEDRETDWEKPRNMRDAQLMEDSKLKEYGLDAKTLREDRKLLADITVDESVKDEIRQRQREDRESFRIWKESRPWNRKSADKAPPADSPSVSLAPPPMLTGTPLPSAAPPAAGLSPDVPESVLPAWATGGKPAPAAVAPAARPGAPKIGEVRRGFRFKGGDPADRANWEKAG